MSVKLGTLASCAAAVHKDELVGACVDNHAEQLLVRSDVKISIVGGLLVVCNVYIYLRRLLAQYYSGKIRFCLLTPLSESGSQSKGPAKLKSWSFLQT